MRRAPILAAPLAALAAIVVLSSADLARAEGSWGVVVFREGGDFVTSRWGDADQLTLGSAPANDLVLPELAPEHAVIRREGGGFELIPSAEVKLEERIVTGSAALEPGATVTAGSYRLQLLVLGPELAEPLEDEPEGASPLPLDPEGAGAAAAAGRGKVFEGSAYRFCHDPAYGRRGVVGHELCAVLDETSFDACPALKESCPWPEPSLSYGAGSGRGGRGGGEEAGRRQEQRVRLFNLPQLPPVVAWIVIGLVIGVIVFAFVRAFLRGGWEDDQEPGEVVLDEAARNLQALPEAKSRSLLELARRAHARGDAAEAALLLHLAVLRFLDDEGLARYHPSKTNGDYLRSIRAHRELARLFRGVANETERLRFGDGRVDAERLDALLGDAPALLVQRSPAGGPAPALGSLALFALLGALGCGPEEGGSAFYSHAPLGLSALAPLLRDAGLQVELGAGQAHPVDSGADLVVVATSGLRDRALIEHLRLGELLALGTSVVLLDDGARSRTLLSTSATVALEGGAATLAFGPTEGAGPCVERLQHLSPLFDAEEVRLPRGRRLISATLTHTATISGSELVYAPLLVYRGQPQLTGGQHAAVAFAARPSAAPAGCLYVFSDRDLFSNASLTRRPNARFVAALFASLAGPSRRVAIMDHLAVLDGSSSPPSPSPARALKASNMLPFLLQALATLVLVFIAVGAAFGPLRDRVKREHKAFVEHVEAIGRQYARTGQAGLAHAATSLARLAVVRHRNKLRGGGGWGAVAAELARKHDLPEEDVRAALRLGLEGSSELGEAAPGDPGQARVGLALPGPGPADPSASSERMLRTLSRLLRTERGEPHSHRSAPRRTGKNV